MKKTILLVEDEAQVRLLVERVLMKRDCTVLSAANGREALELVSGRIDEVDLVISDLVMPEMGGRALLKELHAQRADLPVLFMTGYSDEDIEKEGSLEGAHLIQKPFTPVQLIDRVKQIL